MNNRSIKYGLFTLACYIAFSLVGKLFSPDSSLPYYVFLLLFAFPAFNTAVGAYFAFKHGFDVMLPIVLGIAFLPIVYLFYNSSALIYCLIYGCFASAGCLVGNLIKKLSLKK